MKQLVAISLLLWSLGARADGTPNLNDQGVILDGYDPVSYFKSEKPVKGDSKFQAKYGEANYWFSSAANKDEFLKDPKKYEPQYGGWCAYAIADSKSKVEVEPTSFVIQEGRLFVFYLRKGIFGKDTRAIWQKKPNEYLKEADANWPEVLGAKK